MKITKYPQSCLVIEHNNKRLIIDPGSLVSQRYKAADMLPLDGILITHEHVDHADPEFIKSLVNGENIPVVGNQSTANLLGNLVSLVIKNGDELDVAGFAIKAFELPHCNMVDGSPGPQNTGFIVNKTFFHPGDGVEINNLKIKASAVPIAGPDISPHDVYKFVMDLGCQTVIPIHFDYFPGDPHFIATILSGNASIKVVVLENGETVEV
jgi:L-ascorbate metabolism protein UlaG (beta-lactamase superfamily)